MVKIADLKIGDHVLLNIDNIQEPVPGKVVDRGRDKDGTYAMVRAKIGGTAYVRAPENMIIETCDNTRSEKKGGSL